MISTFTGSLDLRVFQIIALTIFSAFYLIMLFWVFRGDSKKFYRGIAVNILNETKEEVGHE